MLRASNNVRALTQLVVLVVRQIVHCNSNPIRDFTKIATEYVIINRGALSALRAEFTVCGLLDATTHVDGMTN